MKRYLEFVNEGIFSSGKKKKESEPETKIEPERKYKLPSG
jgi:hypothetical protein